MQYNTSYKYDLRGLSYSNNQSYGNNQRGEVRKVFYDANANTLICEFYQNGKWLPLIGNGGRDAFDIRKSKEEYQNMVLWREGQR